MTSPTRQRTYSKDQWLGAQDAWADGDFSDEWTPWRRLAAQQGILFPPEGTKYDSWGDDDPSQRAILIRAIRETPELLRYAITSKGVHSWASVIAVLVRGRDETRDIIAADEAAEDRYDEPTPKQATYALKQILDIIGDS